MKRFIPYILLITGICLSVTAVLVTAQDAAIPEERLEYAGSRECRDCHGALSRFHNGTAHALTMAEVEEDTASEDSPVIADFSAGEDERTVTFPDSNTERPFELADVAYTLGVGRNVQAYLYEADDDVYYVFPADWDARTGQWRRFELAENWPDEAYEYGKNCAGCHTVGIDVEDNYEWEEIGVQCEACHGPGLAHVEAADDAGGTISAEELEEIQANIHLALDSQSCGQCHARGLATDGIHPYAVGYYPGLVELGEVFELVDTADDVHWWETGHARRSYMQYNEWVISGHPNALESAQESEHFQAECLTCHSVVQELVELRLANRDIDPDTVDPHALIETHSNGVTCASCHSPHDPATDDEEMTLAGNLREESYALCTSCHRNTEITDGIHYPVQQVFEGHPFIEHIDAEPSAHFTAENGPTCVTCHMPTAETFYGARNSHTFKIAAPGEAIDLEALQDSCTICHEQNPAELQQLIDVLQNGTRQRIDNARNTADDDTAEWVFVALDVVEKDGSLGMHNYAYTSALLGSVELELGLGTTSSMTNEDVAAEINAVLPEVEAPEIPVNPQATFTTGGLTAPSIILLIIVAGILIVSAYAFFFRRDT